MAYKLPTILDTRHARTPEEAVEVYTSISAALAAAEAEYRETYRRFDLTRCLELIRPLGNLRLAQKHALERCRQLGATGR